MNRQPTNGREREWERGREDYELAQATNLRLCLDVKLHKVRLSSDRTAPQRTETLY